MQKGSRPTTLEDVARVAGVSRSTVSRVVNGQTTVDPALRAVVEQAVAATSYVPNHAARSLVTRRTEAIALIVSEAEHRKVEDPFVGRMFSDPFFGRVVSGITSVARAERKQLVLILVDDAASRDNAVGYVRQGHVDGVLLVSGYADDPLPDMLAHEGCAAVAFGSTGTPGLISGVDADQRQGSALAAERLAADGRRRLATIAGPLDMIHSRDRLAGFRDAVIARGLPEPLVVEGEFTQASGARAMTRLLEEVPDLDGVFVASDLMVLGALPVLARAGRRVPEDVAVVGFDDSSAALACDPPLTTVRQPVEEMAAQMTRMLLRRIDDPREPLQTVVFHPTLVVRESA